MCWLVEKLCEVIMFVKFAYRGFFFLLVASKSISCDWVFDERAQFSGQDRWDWHSIHGEAVARLTAFEGPNKTVQYKGRQCQARCGSIGEMKASLFFMDEYEFSAGVHKIPVGLWGGGGGNCISGGCPVGMRDGFSVRLMEKAGELLIYIYSPSGGGLNIDGKDYGKVIKSDVYLTVGRWENIHLIVVLDNSELNISLSLNEELVGSFTLIDPALETWCIKGVMLTEHWGGDDSSAKNWSFREQFLLLKGVSLKLR